MNYDKTPLEKSVWYGEPCKRISLESVWKYESCNSHRDSIVLEAHSKVAASPLEALQCASSCSAMKQAFASTRYLCKHRIAHATNYEPLLDLLTVLGLDVKSKIALGKKCYILQSKVLPGNASVPVGSHPK